MRYSLQCFAQVAVLKSGMEQNSVPRVEHDNPSAPKQNRSGCASLVLVAIGVVGVILVIVFFVGQQTPTQTKTDYMVTYRVEGGGSADVTFTNDQGGSSQESPVRLPWEKIQMFQWGSTLYVSAQAHSYDHLVVSILVDGKVIKSSESTGEYVIASASSVLKPID